MRRCASCTTLPHFAISLLMRAPNSSGLFATGTKPSLQQMRRDVRLGHRLGDLAVQQVDDRLRRAGRRQNAGQRVGLLAGIAGFLHGRHVGQFRAALDREHGERRAIFRS